jgi:hypothetical protein
MMYLQWIYILDWAFSMARGPHPNSAAEDQKWTFDDCTMEKRKTTTRGKL